MQAVLRSLTSRWAMSLVGIVILALLIWFFGPLLEPLEGWLPRLAVVLFLLLVWGASNLLLDLLRQRREQTRDRPRIKSIPHTFQKQSRRRSGPRGDIEFWVLLSAEQLPKFFHGYLAPSDFHQRSG